MKIEELEGKIAEDLAEVPSLAHPGYRIAVQLSEGGRKKKKNASADCWTPQSGEILIRFEPDIESSPKASPDPAISVMPKVKSAPDPIADVVRSLDRAESKPGYEFVALKWFRDVFLPAEKFDWSESDSARQAVLRDAIEKRFILTGKVENPKTPQFPVTAIRVNRLLPDVQKILGATTESDSGFEPVDIPGEALSATVLRERR